MRSYDWSQTYTMPRHLDIVVKSNVDTQNQIKMITSVNVNSSSVDTRACKNFDLPAVSQCSLHPDNIMAGKKL